ncbi:hypothetical protein [Arthrobacter sp. UYCu723]
MRQIPRRMVRERARNGNGDDGGETVYFTVDSGRQSRYSGEQCEYAR